MKLRDIKPEMMVGGFAAVSIIGGVLGSLVFGYPLETGLRYGLIIGLTPMGVVFALILVMFIWELFEKQSKD